LLWRRALFPVLVWQGSARSAGVLTMCNLYNQTAAKEAMRRVVAALPREDRTGNLGPADIYPDRMAAIVRAEGPGMAR